MFERASLQRGMAVRGSGGERLGRLLGCGRRHLLLRSGAISRKRLAVSYADVESLRGGIVRLRRGRDALLPPDAVEGPVMEVLPLDPEAKSIRDSAAELL